MPLTISCPSCPTKLKVPDDAGGRRIKCPKCGGVMTVPAGGADADSGTQPPSPARPVSPVPTPAPVPRPVRVAEPPAPPAARRAPDDDDRPARRVRSDDDDRPARRRRDDDRDDADEAPGGRLHPGWKRVALGYRMLGFAMLALLVGWVVTAGAIVATGMSVGNGRNADEVVRLVAFGVGGFFVLVVGVLTLLGHLFLMGMPRDEDGGKGKTLAVVMLVLALVPGLQVVIPILLAVFSGGVGDALDKPKLRRRGYGLFIWYAIGLILQPLLMAAAFFGGAAIDRSGVFSVVAALAVNVVIGLLVYISVWSTFVHMRRGILTAVRERGVIGGEGPQPAATPKKGSRDRTEGEESTRDSRRRRTRDDDDTGAGAGGEPSPAAPPAPRRAQADDDAPPARRMADDDYRPDDADGAAAGRLHRGWKMIAVGYRMLGLKMLCLLLGAVAAAACLVAFDGWKAIEFAASGNKLTESEIGQLTIPLVAFGAAAGLGGFLGFLGLLFLMWMPKPEDGGKGKVLAIVMFILPFVGLAALIPLLLPIFSAGIGTALEKPRVRRYGYGMYLWYAIGLVVLPLLTWGAYLGAMALLNNEAAVAVLVAGVVALVGGLVVFLSVWGSLAGVRQGISAAVRERGVIGGQAPVLPTPSKKGRGRATRDDDDDDRPRRKRDDDSDDEIPKAKKKRDDDSDHDSDDGDDRPRRTR